MAIKTIVSESGKFAYDRFHFAQATESNGLCFVPVLLEVERIENYPVI